jgi:hypothetical protein
MARKERCYRLADTPAEVLEVLKHTEQEIEAESVQALTRYDPSAWRRPSGATALWRHGARAARGAAVRADASAHHHEPSQRWFQYPTAPPSCAPARPRRPYAPRDADGERLSHPFGDLEAATGGWLGRGAGVDRRAVAVDVHALRDGRDDEAEHGVRLISSSSLCSAVALRGRVSGC